MEEAKKTTLRGDAVCATVLGLFISLSAFFGIASTAHAATLFLSPSSGEFTVGKTFSVNVYVSSADQAMNAASGIFTFPTDKLEVTSLSKSGSIVSLWVQEPAYSNGEGTVNFEGIVLNPGYQKVNGKIITVTFKVKTAGTAQCAFSSGSVLANDGNGTNILKGLGGAKFNLVGEAPAEIPPETPATPEPTPPAAPPVTGTPAAPVIVSPTHPDSNAWYATKDASFTWRLPAGITGTRLLFGKKADATPSVTYPSAIGSKDIPNVEDGVWYFTVQLRNANGWGGISHYRFQVDTAKPNKFDITEVPKPDPTDPKTTFIFEATDELSGIDHYEVSVDGGAVETWRDDGSHRYMTAILGPGKHTLIAKAIDKAGNALSGSAEFAIEPIAPPVITEYPKSLQSGEPLLVRGATQPNSSVTVWIQKEQGTPKSYTIKSDSDGAFAFAPDEKLSDGVYKLWAETLDARGAKSGPGQTVIISVAKLPMVSAGTQALNYLNIIVPLASLLLILLFVLWYAWHRFKRVRKKLRKEVRDAETTLHDTFTLLKSDIKDQIRMLERARTKRELTLEEEKIVKRLKKDLDYTENFIKKELANIEKTLK
jgi:hypothetical protein